MPDLRQFERELEKLKAELTPTDELVDFTQVSMADKTAVFLLLRVTRAQHRAAPLLMPSWEQDPDAVSAIRSKARKLGTRYADIFERRHSASAASLTDKELNWSPDEALSAWLIAKYPQHVDPTILKEAKRHAITNA